LVLADNLIKEIPRPTESDIAFAPSRLRSVSLWSNRVHSWACMDALSEWLPSLEQFNVQDNPILEDPVTVNCARQLLIARFPRLVSCNGSTISSSERKDAELFYLSFVIKNAASPEDRVKNHPQWRVLVAKYGEQEEGRILPTSNNLGSRMIELYINQLSTTLPNETTLTELPSKPSKPIIKVLPSMTLKTLRIKVLKALQVRPSPGARTRLWALLHGPNSAESVIVREMHADVDGGKEIDFWGFETGCGVGVLIE